MPSNCNIFSLQINGKRVPMELKMLNEVQNVPGVIQLLAFYELRNEFIFVFERPSPCMDLHDFIKKFGVPSEELACDFFSQIVATVKSCHDHGIVHRDIKLENILVDLKNLKLKLIDFGCSALVKKEDFTDFGGTQIYSPPEWFMDKSYQGEPFTVWTLGVLLYVMVFGAFPFDTNEDVWELEFLGKELSDNCKDIILRCLEQHPEDRITLEEILEHSFCFPNENNSSSIEQTIQNANINSLIQTSNSLASRSDFSSGSATVISSDLENQSSAVEFVGNDFSKVRAEKRKCHSVSECNRKSKKSRTKFYQNELETSFIDPNEDTDVNVNAETDLDSDNESDSKSFIDPNEDTDVDTNAETDLESDNESDSKRFIDPNEDTDVDVNAETDLDSDNESDLKWSL